MDGIFFWHTWQVSNVNIFFQLATEVLFSVCAKKKTPTNITISTFISFIHIQYESVRVRRR